MNIAGANTPETTPIADISGLKDRTIRTQAELFEAEAKNILKAISHYLGRKPTQRMAPFTLSWTRKLHRNMLGDVWGWAGKIRETEPNIGLSLTRFQVESAITNMLADLAEWAKSGMDLIEQAARLHHRAVAIHPFENGNGRWARLLCNIWLKQHDSPITAWPDKDMLDGESRIRTEYIDAVKSADKGDFEPLVALHRRYTKA